jgi:putative addiction module component (TIGR02574 family)
MCYYLEKSTDMTAQTMELIEMAEALPIDEKALLVDKLLDSMYPHQKEIDELWRLEAERRVEEVRSGKVTPIPGEQVFSEIEQRFGK